MFSVEAPGKSIFFGKLLYGRKNPQSRSSIHKGYGKRLPYARAFSPDVDEKIALGDLLLDEIKKAQINENIEEGDVQVVEVIGGSEEAEKKESKATSYLIQAREISRTILTSSTITDEMRKNFLQFFEETSGYDKELREIITPIRGGGGFLYAKIALKDYEEVNSLMKNSKKIPAIVKIRQLTGWGLIEVKDCADRWI